MPIHRRKFISTLAVASVGAILSQPGWSQNSGDLRVNGQRLRESLEGLSLFGRPAGGSFSDGVSRSGFSDAALAGRSYVMQLMRGFGLEPRIDPAGNIFGARAGRDKTLKPILFGSHIDSVLNGGNFDGDVGSMSAIEVMHTLQENNVPTRHALQMVVWTDEENTFAGSGSAAGVLRAEDLDRVTNGISTADGIRKLGGDRRRLSEARLAPGSFRCYLELHIEQGGMLEQSKLPIGVVEGIVAIDQYEVEIRGFANHSGTTPMKDRHNALLAAAHLVEAVQEIVIREPGKQVGTVGQLEVFPNAPNVVPGLVKHTVELRDLSAEKIARLGEEIKKRSQEIAQQTGTEIKMERVEHDPPALADPALQSKIETAATGLGLKTIRLPSGAGHDAQMMAKVGPMAMIFVPSVGGISHSPKEFTRWPDCTNGANVLLQTILLVDRP